MNNVDPFGLVFAEIDRIVTGLNRKGLRAADRDLSNLIGIWGQAAERYLLRCLFSLIDTSVDNRGQPKDSVQAQLLVLIFTDRLNQPGFLSNLCYAYDCPLVKSTKQAKRLAQSKQTGGHLVAVCRTLKFSSVQEVVFGLCLLQSDNSETRLRAVEFLKRKFDVLLEAYKGTDANSEAIKTALHDHETLHLLLVHLSEEGDDYAVKQGTKDDFVNGLKKDLPEIQTPVILRPLLYPDGSDAFALDLSTDRLQVDPAMLRPITGSLALQIQEIGYGFTASVDDCKHHLSVLGVSELTPSTVAHLLAMMVRTHTGLKDGVAFAMPSSPWPEEPKDGSPSGPQCWNVDVLVTVLQELYPNLNWTNVVIELDQPGFHVKDRMGLNVLMEALRRGLAAGEGAQFPTDAFYNQWNNKDGQISWMQQILRNPDIFSFVDLPYRSVQYDILKTPPDESNKEIISWKSLDLLESLLNLSEAPGLYRQVAECFNVPMNLCPDLLVLGLLQIGSPMNSLRREVLTNVIPVFLSNHPNAHLVLQYAWGMQSQNGIVRQIILQSMAEWYKQPALAPITSASQARQVNDQQTGRLVKILEVAHELKALTMLLAVPEYPFAIDLACLASRRDYLKLDKWLTDNIHEHGEKFVSNCVEFLKKRCPGITGSNMLASPPPPSQLPADTLTTVLMCLQSTVSNVSPTIGREILQLLTSCRMLLSNKSSSVTPGPGSSSSNLAGSVNAGLQLGTGPIGAGGLSGMGVLGGRTHGSGQSLLGSTSGFGGTGGVGLLGPSTGISGVGSTVGGRPRLPQGMGGMLGGGAPGDMFRGGNQMDNLIGGSSSTGMDGFSAGGGLAGFGGGGGVPGFGAPPPRSGSALGSGGFQPGSELGVPHAASPAQGMFGSGGGFGAPGGSLDGVLGSRGPGAVGFQPGSLMSRGGVVGGFQSPADGAMGSIGMQPGAAGSLGSGMAGSAGSALGTDSGVELNRPFSDEVQDDANLYFQQIYSMPPQPTMTVDQFLDVLRKCKDSSDQRERDVFACMLKNLFEEYRFFPQYPDKELYITSLLFGGIIRENLVQGMSCIFALRAVLEAIKKEPESKMYNFGVCALDQFKTKLKLYPKYCCNVKSIVHYNKLPPTIIDFVECGGRCSSPPGSSSKVDSRSDTPVVPWPGVHKAYQEKRDAAAAASKTPKPVVSGAGSSGEMSTGVVAPQPLMNRANDGLKQKPPSLNAPDIETLEKATDNDDIKVVHPPESIVERIAFLFNNLSKANLRQKTEEIKGTVTDLAHFPWLAQYLVMKRASIEPNFHPLYSTLLDKFDDVQFYCLVRIEAYRNIKILLRSDKSVTNFSDRTLLKNLGLWLGMITVGKNKPILHKDLDVKSLLLEAYYKGQQELLYVVPFIAKILESCEHSKIFIPPNPWTMSLLNAMAELHREPDLKLNLKFEIEVLCKKLDVDIQNLSPGNILKDTERLANLDQQLSNPIKLEKPTMPAITGPSPLPRASVDPTGGGTVAGGGHQGAGGQPGGGGEGGQGGMIPSQPKFAYHDINIISMSHLQSLVYINASLQLFKLNPPLKALVPRAIERAVQDLLIPVADRAIRPSMTITEHIVKKDFALDPDESHMRLAAQHMIRAMTAGMAMISCREALLMMMQNYLKQTLLSQYRGANADQQCLIDEAAVAVAEDNVELAQCFITKSAVERAVPEIERRLQNEFETRRLARAENRRYCDLTTLSYQAERMPESIRLKVGSITPVQQRIYGEFAKSLPGFKPTSEEEYDPVLTKNTATTEDKEHHYRVLLREVDACLSSSAAGGMLASPGVKGMQALREMLVLASNDAGVTMQVIRHCVEGLLENYRRSNTDLEWMKKLREAYLLTLRAAMHISVQCNVNNAQWFQKQVTRCVLECRQEARYNIDAIDVLIRAKLINMVTFDISLAQQMNTGLNFAATDFAVQLVRLYFVENPKTSDNVPVLTENDLSNTLEVLMRATASNRPMNAESSNLADIVELLRTPLFLGSAGGAGGPSGVSQSGAAGVGNLSSLLGQQAGGVQHPGHLGAAGSTAANASFLEKLASIGQIQAAGSYGGRTSTVLGASGSVMGAPMPGSGPGATGAPIPNAMSDDPPGLHEKAEQILREWVGMYHSPQRERDFLRPFHHIVAQMHSNGVLKTDELITRFFRLCTEMCVDLCYRSLLDVNAAQTPPGVVRQRCFYTLDAYVKLIALLVRHSAENDYQVKIHLLHKVLNIVTSVLLQDHEIRRGEFHQLPYHRILMMLFVELVETDPVLNEIHLEVLRAFCTALNMLQPKKAPGFTFAWLDIIGHRTFISKMLNVSPQVAQTTWPMYAQLVLSHLKFLAPFLRNIEMTPSIRMVYKGTLRILLVLLHDFAELLCDFHYPMCDVIPPNCVQLRNLILSAYPRHMRLPDPFLPNFKVDQLLPEISQSPQILGVNIPQIIGEQLKSELDSYLKNRNPVSFLSELRGKLQVSQEPGQKYNGSLMNAIVLYVGTQAIKSLQADNQIPSVTNITHTAHMDIFQNLAVDLDNEGRYLFFNAIANQLRYPNSHTNYFSCTLLSLFAEANQECIQEQITRILFERLVAMRPHPWGLLITFIQLIKEPQYNFWSHKYVRCAPEIERLFETMAKSCMQTRQSHETTGNH